MTDAVGTAVPTRNERPKFGPTLHRKAGTRAASADRCAHSATGDRRYRRGIVKTGSFRDRNGVLVQVRATGTGYVITYPNGRTIAVGRVIGNG